LPYRSYSVSTSTDSPVPFCAGLTAGKLVFIPLGWYVGGSGDELLLDDELLLELELELLELLELEEGSTLEPELLLELELLLDGGS